MAKERLYRVVERMSLAALLRERDLLQPLIRDVIAAKRARVAELSAEIARRGHGDGTDAKSSETRGMTDD